MGHRNLSKLGKDIQDQIKRLEFGELKASELDELVEDARDLYDRLTVLRYRYYDEKIKALKRKEKLDNEIPVLFKIDENPDSKDEDPSKKEIVTPNNQTSLIDAIEEVDAVDSIPKETEDKPVESPKPVVKEEKIDPEITIEIDEIESLVEKMEKAPIKNLKKEINLNLKFRFINELFGGNANEYNALIDKIDAAGSTKNADEIVKKDGSEKHHWEWEMEEVELFMELIERRFI